MRELSFRIAAALVRLGVAPGDKVAILSANDPVAFTCVFGISRAGAVWCPINPRNEAAENRELLDLFDCTVLIHQQSFAPLVDQIRGELPKLTSDRVPGRCAARGDAVVGGVPGRGRGPDQVDAQTASTTSP